MFKVIALAVAIAATCQRRRRAGELLPTTRAR